MRLLLLIFTLVYLLNAKELEKVSLQFQWINQFQFAGYYIAKEKGFYESIGLEVELKEMKRSLVVTDEVINNKSTYGIGRASLIIDKVNGKNIKLLASIFQSSPLILLARKDSNIKTIKDFIGKRIMMTGDAASSASLQAMYNKYDVKESDVIKLEQTFSIDSLINNETDLSQSYISNQPFLLHEKGIDYTVFNPKDYGFDLYDDILFTSNYETEHHKQRTINFKKASLKGWEYAFNNIEETVEIILSKYNGQGKTRKALLFEANKLKELAYDKTTKVGEITKSKIQRIYDIYNILGLVDMSKPLDINSLIFDEIPKISLNTNEEKWLKDRKSITMCIEPNWLPFEKFEGKKHVGITADYFKHFQKSIGKKIDVIYTDSWTQSLVFAQQRKCDILSAVMKTEDRKKYLNFTKPYLESSLALATKNNVAFINNIETLKGKTICMPKGYVFTEILKSKYPYLNIIEVKNISDGLQMVRREEVFGYFGSIESIAYNIRNKFYGELKVAGKFKERLELGIGVRNDEPILLNILNKAISSIDKDKKQNIMNRWMPITYEKKLDYTLIIGIVLIVFIILVFFFYRQYLLKQINNKLEARVRQEVRENNDKSEKLVQITEEKNKELSRYIKIFSENVIASSSDLKGNITYVSKALCEISGYSEEELIRKPHSILQSTSTPKSVFRDLWETIQSGQTWTGELKNDKKDGGYYWVFARIIPNYDNSKNIIGYSSVRQDITAEKAKEQFLANMSHELRTPLNSIIGFSGILNKKQTDSSLLSFSQNINTSANTLLKLINDILDLSKIQDSEFKIDMYEFNAYEEIIKHSEQFDGLLVQKDLTLNTKINKKLESIFLGDWLRISQIILNLISNAVKFTAENGEITYEVEYIEKHLVITIKDNGIGMNKEVQDKVFKPFSQADGSTTRKYGGTGLGLSITQKLVELMQGTIELESEVDKGTTFRVKVPLQFVGEVSTDNLNQIIVENKDDTLIGHILIVEDNKTNQMLLQMILSDFGLTCDIANDGLEAIKMYDIDKHALILMDENMPNMNGLEAMKVIREKYTDKCGPIIALTANAMTGDRNKFISLGMDGYVAKPIDEDELYNTLVEYL